MTPTDLAISHRLAAVEQTLATLPNLTAAIRRLESLVTVRPHQLNPPHIVANDVLPFVAARFKTTPTVLRSPLRNNETVLARWVACRLMRGEGLGLVAIGRLLHRDHCAVLYGLRELQCRVETEPKIAALVADVEKEWSERSANGQH